MIRILFTFDPAARLDLFRTFPAIRSFFRQRRNMAYLRTFGDIAFSVLILLGIFGPQDPASNISLFLSWGVWWTGVVLSWFFVGKLWCGVCPFLGIGRLFQRLGMSLNLDPPHALRRYFLHIAVFLFAAIIWTESVTDMKHQPFGTAMLLLAILTGATVMGILFKGQAWCRYACPLGKIIGAGATMSMIELRATPDLCRTCHETACKKGREGIRGCPVYLGAHNIRNSLDCLLCGRCVLLCDRRSPRLQLRNPFVELIAAKGRDLTCTFIIPFLAGSQWARFLAEGRWQPQLMDGSAIPFPLSFSLTLILCCGLFLTVIAGGNRLMGIKPSSLPIHCSPMIPILTPLAFSGELIYRLEYFLSELGAFPAVAARQFGLPVEHLAFTLTSRRLEAVSLIVLALGAAGSLYVTRLFQDKRLKEMPEDASFLPVRCLVALICLGYVQLVV